MTDKISRADRSRNMSRIKNKDTKPEMIVRQYLFAQGFRYRLHDKKLMGKPDLVLPKYRAVIFIHGCFWHRHRDCQLAYTPKSREEFWLKKFDDNVKRDNVVKEALHHAGWRILTIWECALRSKDKSRHLESAAKWLISSTDCQDIGDTTNFTV